MSQPKFEGREPLLKGFIYDVTSEQNPDQYITTMKEITNYVGRTYTKYTAEFTQAVRDLELDAPAPPENPDPGDVLAFEVWKLDIKEHRIKERNTQTPELDYTMSYLVSAALTHYKTS